MRELAAACGIGDRVVFTGRVEHAALPIYYNAADVLVVPSSYESFGMVGLEALACGTPVAATRVGAMDELITPERNGCIAQGFAPQALALAIERTLALPVAGTDLGRQETRRAVARYGWPQVAHEVLQVYRAVLPAGERMTGECLAEASLTAHARG